MTLHPVLYSYVNMYYRFRLQYIAQPCEICGWVGGSRSDLGCMASTAAVPSSRSYRIKPDSTRNYSRVPNLAPCYPRSDL
jgi:hypothetical protein